MNAASCTAVTPVAPQVNQAICRGGVLEPPTLVLADTDGITYTADPEGPYVAGQRVTVTATLDEAGVGWPDSMPGWTETGSTTATYPVKFIWTACVPQTPLYPVTTEATCTAGEVTVPTVVLPTGPAGVTYTVDPAGPYDGTVTSTVTVTATLADGYAWGNLGAYTKTSNTTATYTETLNAASCTAVTPVAPQVNQAICRGGVLEPPTLVLADTDGITYTADPEGPYVAGQRVTVTATLDEAGVGWPDSMPGWTETGSTTATYPVKFIWTACVPQTPLYPVTTEATCTAGEVTVPTVVLPTGPAGVTYTVDPAGPYDGTVTSTVTVTATLADGYAWGNLGAYTKTSNTTATYTETLNAASCTAVTPVAPQVNQAICRGGVLEPPTLVLADTDGITYTADPEGPYVAGQRVTVTATLDEAGVGWPDSMPGWTETGSTTATYPVKFIWTACVPQTPLYPVTTEATCTAGEVTVPTVVLPTGPAGVTYTVDPAGPYDGTVTSTVTVTATLADGYAWGNLGAYTKTSNTTATYTETLNAASCTAVTPVAPQVNQAICRGGVLEPPTLVLADTDGITYTADPEGPYVAGQRVTVTATLTRPGLVGPTRCRVDRDRFDDGDVSGEVHLDGVCAADSVVSGDD